MTQVLRAATVPAGPRALRVAWVRDGRIVDERLIGDARHVSVGPTEKCNFVLAEVPRSHRLFEHHGGSYRLHLTSGMRARVAKSASEAPADVEGPCSVELTHTSRGRVHLGQSAFLFQFVPRPPVQPRPRLPISVTRGALSLDVRTTGVAALSFLLHFLAVGVLYSDWMDPVMDDAIVVSGALAELATLPVPPAEVETPEVDASSTKTPEPTAPSKTPGTKGKGGNGSPGGASPTSSEAGLTQELERLELATLAALNGEGPATSGVLRDGEVPTAGLDAAARSNAGISDGRMTLRTTGPLRPGQSGDLASLATKQRQASNDSGSVETVAPPKGSVNVPAPSNPGGAIKNAASVVASMRAGFRHCYNRGLVDSPDAQGSVRLVIQVGPGGEVQGVQASPSGNLPGSVVSCIRSRAQAASFDPPEGGSGAVVVPVSLIKQ
ncbi:MAG: AgmX/PglI C-terminal domain-containing protein [Polyangiaceae bacterium]